MIKIDNTPPKIVAADLDSLFNEIEQEQNRIQYFQKIARYGEYIQNNKFAFETLSKLYQEAHDDVKVYLNEWKKFVSIWKQYASDLIAIADKEGIKDNPKDPFSNEIATIANRLNVKNTSVWETDLDYYYSPYRTLIVKFKEKEKDNLLIPHHIEQKDGMLRIYPFYVKAVDEWDKFKNSRETKVWWAHYQICRLAVGVLGIKEREQYFKTDDIIDDFYRHEFREVAKGNVNHSPIVLHKHKYEVWIKRLHNYLIPRLQSISNDIPVVVQGVEDKELSKSELKAKINNILKTGKFGKKEKSFIRFLSKDFKPKYIKTIEAEIGSKAGKQLKARVKGKLRNTGFSLESVRADKWGAQAQYQLKFLTQDKTDST